MSEEKKTAVMVRCPCGKLFKSSEGTNKEYCRWICYQRYRPTYKGATSKAWGKKRRARTEIVEECQIDAATHWRQLPMGTCTKCKGGNRWLYSPAHYPKTKLCGSCVKIVVAASVPEYVGDTDEERKAS